MEGERSVLDLKPQDGCLTSFEYPDALARLWSALCAPHAGDLVVSLAEGYECLDWGGTGHVGGGSHGSLCAATRSGRSSSAAAARTRSTPASSGRCATSPES